MKSFIFWIFFAMVVFGTENCSISGDQSARRNAVSQPDQTVIQYMDCLERGQNDIALSFILEPDKPYNPEVVRRMADESSRRLDKNLGETSSLSGYAIPIRVDWVEIFREEDIRFKQILGQEINSDTATVTSDFEYLKLPGVTQVVIFSLKETDGRWLIADVNLTGELHGKPVESKKSV